MVSINYQLTFLLIKKKSNPLISPRLAETNAMLTNFDKQDRDLSENSFKVVSHKPRPIENKSEIETSNKFQHLMDVEEQENLTELPKIFIPAINLKLTIDYNLTLQEISRNHPETTNKYDLGYIKITPNSLEDREKILDYLNKSEKEYVLSEAPDARPIKIVIKDLPQITLKKIFQMSSRNLVSKLSVSINSVISD
ncbi:hypothetical protein AVEN_98802-1 [Araneus ventricosus]|uniref:Pre-C2HC domain-containing protein n=1 Tax=Araneus ventricosus TaxID=182803 RepID=A0A4Y2VXQ1_ARAVE|nr:hypothetical protein AVEN_98802-1 [Araneus ventricosus]